MFSVSSRHEILTKIPYLPIVWECFFNTHPPMWGRDMDRKCNISPHEDTISPDGGFFNLFQEIRLFSGGDRLKSVHTFAMYCNILLICTINCSIYWKTNRLQSLTISLSTNWHDFWYNTKANGLGSLVFEFYVWNHHIEGGPPHEKTFKNLPALLLMERWCSVGS